MELGDFTGAEDAIRRAAALATSIEAKEIVEQLRMQIGSMKILFEAERAQSEGLHFKAADLYRQLLKAPGIPSDKLVNAAEFILNQTDDLETAVAMLREAERDTQAGRASRLLLELGPRISLKSRQLLEEAKAYSGANQVARLRKAIALDSQNREAQVLLANALAYWATSDQWWPEWQEQMKILNRAGWLTEALNGGRIPLRATGRPRETLRLLADMFGRTRAIQLLGLRSYFGNEYLCDELEYTRQAQAAEATGITLVEVHVQGRTAKITDVQVVVSAGQSGAHKSLDRQVVMHFLSCIHVDGTPHPSDFKNAIPVEWKLR